MTVLKIGSTGPEVVALQKLIRATPDGKFGPETERLLKIAQTIYGLDPDGIYGPLSAAAFSKTSAAPAPSGHIPGVDLSRYQHGMNWAALKAAGMQFAIVKATDGLGTDADYKEFRQASHQAGLATGSYHFFRFDHSGEEQADHMLRVMGGLLPGEFISLDFEWDNLASDHGYRDSDHGGTRGTADAAGYQKLLTCAKTIESETGNPPVIYTGGSFWNSKDPAPAAFARYPLWVFGYVSDYSKVKIPPPWSRAAFWQFSGQFNVPGSGVSGIDGNQFFGQREDLLKICKQ